MALVSVSLQEPADAGGVFSTASPSVTPDVTWATVPDFANNPQGTPFSQEFRSAYLSGTGAATATLELVEVAGDTAATLGLAFDGDNLESAAATLGSGTFQVKATYSGADYFSNVFEFSVATTSADTQEPTAPVIKSLSPVGNTQIDIEILPPMDPITPTSVADGMDTVEIHRSVDGGAYSLLTTKDIDAGISPQFQENEVADSPPITVSAAEQTGANWALVTTGLGVYNSNGYGDELTYVGAQITGDFNLYCAIPSYAGLTGLSAATGTTGTAAGLMIRESLLGTSRFYSNGRISNYTSAPDPIYSEVKVREVTAGTIQPLNPQSNLTGTSWFWINRTGDVFTAYIFTQGDDAWTLNDSRVLSMPGTVWAGIFGASGHPTTEAYLSFTDLTLQNLAVVTHSDSGLSENTRYDYKARGVSL